MPIIFHGTGSGGSAKKLKTARTINGTNFDGTANITTANWGTTRTVTVGNTSKSVNGSGNVSCHQLKQVFIFQQRNLQLVTERMEIFGLLMNKRLKGR